MQKKQRLPYSGRETMLAYLFLAPFLILFIGFIVVPAVQSFFYSFTQWEGIGPKKWVGIDNYIEIFSQDEIFWDSMKNNILWMVLSLTFPIFISLWVSNALVRNIRRGAKYYQMILFMPQVLSSVVVATIWKWIYNPIMGPVSALMTSLGLKKLAISGLLGQPDLVMYALFIVSLWAGVGYYTVIFTSAMQGVDTTLYDAASIDGCGRFRQFFAVTLPGIRNTMNTILLLAIIGSFQIFDLVATLTGGGPGYNSYVISFYVYREGFINNRMGYATALSLTLSVILMIISKVFTAIRERGDY